MKTVIIGGGMGCRSLLELTRESFLKERNIDVAAVADVNENAPGLVYARQLGLQTFGSAAEAMAMPGLELVIALTGRHCALEEIKSMLPPGINLIDHDIAKLFWDVENARLEQKKHLAELGALRKDLEKEQHLLQTIFDGLADLAVVIDREHKIVRVNRKFADYIGIDPADAIGRKYIDVLKGTRIECKPVQDSAMFNLILNTGIPQSLIRRTEPPNENHWEITRVAIEDEDGSINMLLGTWHRITEKVLLHREIVAAEHRFKSFINSAQDWISVKDLEGRYVVANTATAEPFGLTPMDFIGKRPEELFPGELSEMIVRNDSEVISSKKPHSFDEIVNVRGEDRHFGTIRFPLTDYKGEISGVCTIARDITNEVVLRQQLITNEKLAALGKLAAGVAHEINNPLTGILAFAEDLLEEAGPDDEKASDYKVIIRETLRCRDIVRNLLDYAKKDEPVFRSVDLKNIIENSLVLVQRLPQFMNISISTDVEEALPRVSGDKRQLQQVLLNFLLNSADAVQDGGVIKISAREDRREQNCVVSVEDSGSGVPNEFRDKIFDPFFTTKGSNGLGLAVCKSIVDQHKGFIEVSDGEHGALFRVHIPYVRQQENSAQ